MAGKISPSNTRVQIYYTWSNTRVQNSVLVTALIPVVSGFTACVDIHVYQWCLGSPPVWTYMYTSGVWVHLLCGHTCIPVVSGFTSCVDIHVYQWCLGSPPVWTYMYTSGVWVHLLCGLFLCGHTCIPVRAYTKTESCIRLFVHTKSNRWRIIAQVCPQCQFGVLKFLIKFIGIAYY